MSSVNIKDEEMREIIEEIRKGEKVVRRFLEKHYIELYEKQGFRPNGFTLIRKNGILEISYSGILLSQIREKEIREEFPCTKKMFWNLRRYLKRETSYECSQKKGAFKVKFLEIAKN